MEARSALDAFVFQLFEVDGASSGEVAVQQPVNHHVGISADRRCEVGVILEPKSVVPDVFGAVDSFCHGPDSKSGKEILLSGAFYGNEHAVEGLVDFFRIAGGFQFISESTRHRSEVGQTLGIRLVVDTENEGFRFPAFRHKSDFCSHGLVCQKHEFLDEFVGFF